MKNFLLSLTLTAIFLMPVFGGVVEAALDPGTPNNSGTVDPGTPSNPGTLDPGTPNNSGSGGSVKLLNPLNADNPNYNIFDFLRSIIEIILVFAIPIIVIFIMYSGFLFVTARGEPAQIQKARAAFTWAIVGGVIVLGAWAILEAVKGTVDAIIT